MDLNLTSTRKWTILLITSISTFMATLDGSIVNIALPIISNELKVSISTIQWVVTSYLLTISILLLVWGRLSDIYGKKVIFSGGFLVFALGSALCSLTHALPVLVIARIIQAIGASAMMSLSQGIVTGTFSASERGRALGFVGTMVALGSLVGPSLGGVLVNAFGWQSIFIINIPIGVIGAVLAFTIIPELFEKQKGKAYDFKGTAAFTLFILVLFLGLLFIQQGIISANFILPTLLLSAASLLMLIFIERHSASPLINLSLFKVNEFSFGLSSAFLSFIAISSSLLFMPFYLQDLLKFSPLKAGLVISVYPITTAIVAPISGWLSDKITYRPLTIVGMCIATVALFAMATLNASSPIYLVIIYLILLGGGLAVFQSPNNSSIMGSVPRHQLGIAGGINALFRNLGLVTGTTLSVLIFSFATKLSISSISSGAVAGGMFTKGLSIVFVFDAVCCFAAVLISLIRSTKNTPSSEIAQQVSIKQDS